MQLRRQFTFNQRRSVICLNSQNNVRRTKCYLQSLKRLDTRKQEKWTGRCRRRRLGRASQLTSHLSGDSDCFVVTRNSSRELLVSRGPLERLQDGSATRSLRESKSATIIFAKNPSKNNFPKCRKCGREITRIKCDCFFFHTTQARPIRPNIKY